MSDLVIKMQISAAIILIAIAICCLLLRRAVFWTSFGLVLGAKGIILAALVLSQILPASNGQHLLLLSLITLLFLALGLITSFAVIIRGQRFDGELDWDSEARMKH